MRLDATCTFVPLTAPINMAQGTAFTVASSVVDLLGSGVGTAPPNIIGNASVFGEDIGIGGGFLMPKLICLTGTAFTTANSATLNIALQGAVDQGSGGSYQPGTWITATETGTMTAAQLTAAIAVARFDWPPAFPAGTLPRYLRLNFTVAASTAFTAGTIAFAGLTSDRDDQSNKYAAGNFTVA